MADLGAWGIVTQDKLTQIDEATGIMYDFNYGCEIKTPATNAVWDVELINADTGNVVYTTRLPGNSYYCTPIKYFIRWQIKMTSKDGKFEHTMNLEGKKVMMRMAHKTLGDCIAYLSQIPYFARKHNCEIIIYAQQWLIDLFEPDWGQYQWITNTEVAEDVYATYYLGIVFDEEQSRYWQKVSYKTQGLQHQAAHILGLPSNSDPCPMTIEVGERPIKDKYVCISYSGSKQCKFWHNPIGWPRVIKYLKSLGYRVFCIDKSFRVGMPGSMEVRPEGCEDLIGDIPLYERATWLAHADMFIGMGSGLAWLAWTVGCPVIMISGFSLPHAEFYTPYRVINEEAECIGCWNNPRIPFNHHEWGWCPVYDAKLFELRQKLAKCDNAIEAHEVQMQIGEVQEHKFICTQSISHEQVIKMIDKVRSDNESTQKSGYL